MYVNITRRRIADYIGNRLTITATMQFQHVVGVRRANIPYMYYIGHVVPQAGRVCRHRHYKRMNMNCVLSNPGTAFGTR